MIPSLDLNHNPPLEIWDEADTDNDPNFLPRNPNTLKPNPTQNPKSKPQNPNLHLKTLILNQDEADTDKAQRNFDNIVNFMHSFSPPLTPPPGGLEGLREHLALPKVCSVHGDLAQKKPNPSRTLQEACAWGPMVILGGWAFLMSKVTL